MILPAVSQAMQLPQKVAEMAVMRLWPEVTSPACQPPATQATGIRRHNGKVQLLVSAANAYVATQLTYEQDQILGRLNCYVPQTGLRVDKLMVRVSNRRS